MTFFRPTLPDLINRTRDDTVSRLPNPEVLRRSDAEVYARVLAGVAHGLYGYLDWLSRQIIYDTADDEYLERWASVWGINRKPASKSGGTVTLTGNTGATVPTGAVLVAYDGQLYATTADATLVAGTAVANVQAVNAGAVGNRVTGQTFTMQSPVSGVSGTALAGAMTGGADIESYDALRSRLLARIKNPPQGGNKSDYERWALEVPGVTRAFVSPQELGIGTVTVRFMMDGLYANGIPQAGDLAAVAAHIEPLRPVTASVSVQAPVAAPLNFTITGLNPLTAAVQAAVTAQLADLLKREAVPGGTILKTHIDEAISVATGEVDHTLTVPAANVTNAVGVISTMGTVSFV